MNQAEPAPFAKVCRAPAHDGRAIATGLVAVGCGWLGLKLAPQVEPGVFSRAAATLAGWLTGVPLQQVDAGWLLAGAGRPVIVTTACSATDYFLMVTALLSWRLARGGRSCGFAVLSGLGAALPVTIFLNALRVVAVTQAHRWLIPRLPEVYGPFFHMLTGVAVFLPALIALNLLLEYHGQHRTADRG